MVDVVSFSFVVHGKPEPAGSKRGFYNAKAGRTYVVDANAKSRPWKALVSDAALQAMTYYDNDRDRNARLPPLEGPLLLELTFWVTRPKGHYGAKGVRPSAPRFPTVKPDVLKLARGVEDALSGICYLDDSQVVSEVLQKAYTDGAPCCEVRISLAEQIIRPSDWSSRAQSMTYRLAAGRNTA